AATEKRVTVENNPGVTQRSTHPQPRPSPSCCVKTPGSELSPFKKNARSIEKSEPWPVVPYELVRAHVPSRPSGIPVKKTVARFTDIYSLSEFLRFCLLR
ncbi:hypothetical protein CRENBAI_009893, partial [Crenichthys baileyi]